VAERRWISRSPEATERLGEELGARLCPGAVVALDGDLGAGKTCFVRGLARGLGVRTPVASPTYALMAQHEGRVPFHHLDAWMEGRERAFLLDGGAECLGGEGVCAVEWAARVADHLPAARIAVEIAHRGPSERAIRVRALGEERDGPLARSLAAIPAIPGLDETG
jgi:tRNA threonylcarbamoyladenosine biosynthesis protein TsaE